MGSSLPGVHPFWALIRRPTPHGKQSCTTGKAIDSRVQSGLSWFMTVGSEKSYRRNGYPKLYCYSSGASPFMGASRQVSLMRYAVKKMVSSPFLGDLGPDGTLLRSISGTSMLRAPDLQ